MEKKDGAVKNVMLGVGYIVPFIGCFLISMFWGNTLLVILVGAAMAVSVMTTWKFLLPLLLMIVYGLFSLGICVIESATKGMYLLTTMKFFNMFDIWLNVIRKTTWEKLKNLTENKVFEILD